MGLLQRWGVERRVHFFNLNWSLCEPPIHSIKIHSTHQSPLLWKRWILLHCIVAERESNKVGWMLEWTRLWSIILYQGFSRLLNHVRAYDLLLILKMSFCCTRSGSRGWPIECLDSSRSASMVLQTIRRSTKTQIHISAKCMKSYQSITQIKFQSKTWIQTCFCHCTWFE